MEKALIVTPFYRPNIGGAETFAEDLAKALSNKYIVHVCTIKWEKPILWQGMNLKKSLSLMRRLIGPLWKMKRKYRYKKVYALGLMSCLLCILLHIKFHAVMLALYDFKGFSWYSLVLNRAQKIFVEGEQGWFDLLMAGADPEKMKKFQHWVDNSRFFYTVRTHKTLRVLFIGRPIKIKGKHIIKECEKLTTGIDYEYIENVPYKDLPNHYQMADVVVVPSLYSEGFSRVVVEAASTGCILVTSNKGSLPNMVKDFGWAIEPTPENFRDVLNQIKEMNRVDIEAKQLKTALYAKKYFGEKNADCFLL